MAKLAILGFGTVGSGVYEVLKNNAAQVARRLGQPLEVARICDVRDFSAHEAAGLFVDSIGPILADESVGVVAETIGGAGVAYGYVRAALAAGKHVVTSNKELVAAHGYELLCLAKEKGVAFLFEASVGGGTPVITPMHRCLAANRITSVAGIVNGTTNFMLERMETAGLSFDEALKEAQSLGYAETIDPSFDVDGLDAGRKIAILASIAFGSHVYPRHIATRGIRQVTEADMAAARGLSCAVKLIAYARQTPEGPAIGVEPMLVPLTNHLAGVSGVYNAVQAECDLLGRVQFYGPGAGKLPTASAVVADAVDALKLGAAENDSLSWGPPRPMEGLYPTHGPSEAYLRAESPAGAKLLRALPGAAPAGEAAVVLPPQREAQLAARMEELAAQGGGDIFAMKIWQ